MDKKRIFRIMIDAAMTVLLLLVMGYMITGQRLHEWLGAAIFALFILHHILNRKWYANILRGKYSVGRVLQTVINILLTAAMLGLMVSGIIMSRYVFDFLPVHGGASFARLLHLLCSHWAFVLMSMHLGLHWGMAVHMMGKIFGVKSTSNTRSIIIRIVAITIAAYGAWSFIKNDFLSYMLLRSTFAFFDFEQPVFMFFLEYFSMMEMWACLAYYIVKLTKKKPKK